MNDSQIVELLTANGLRQRDARVLVCFAEQDDELTSVDIESKAQLRQPEVSIATRELRRRGWLRFTTKHKGGKGAPIKIYRLTAPFGDIVKQIVRERTAEIDRAQELTVQLLQAVA